MFILFSIELVFAFPWKWEQLGQKSKGAVISFLLTFLIKSDSGGEKEHYHTHKKELSKLTL